MKDGVFLPTNSVDSAGYDLYAPFADTIPAHSVLKIPLWFQAEFDPRYVCLMLDKSSIGVKGIGRLAGVIEGSYRGEWAVILANHTDVDFEFRRSQKIVQAVFVEHGLCPVKKVTELRPSFRGAGGFGSTGSMAQATNRSDLEALLSQIPEGSPKHVAFKKKLEILGFSQYIVESSTWPRSTVEAVESYLDSIIHNEGSVKVPEILV